MPARCRSSCGPKTYENAAPSLRPRTTWDRRQAGEAAAAHSHENDDVDWAPADGFQRSAFTALAISSTAIGFAVLLVTASEFAGGMTGWRQGVFWGLAGFAVFTLAPGLGLPPDFRGCRRRISMRGRSGGLPPLRRRLPGLPSWPSRGCYRWRSGGRAHRGATPSRRAEARNLRERRPGNARP